jgi:DinB superfamily
VDPHLKRLQDELSASIQGLSTKELSWHHPDKWCIAEIIEHLYLTYTGTTKGLSRVLASDKAQEHVPTLGQRLRAFVVTGVRYFPDGVKSPPVAIPRGLPSDRSISEIVLKIAEMDEMMSRCAARFGSDTKVLDHPVLGPFSVSQWRKFHWVHGRHHLKQIRQLRSAAGNG